MEEVKSVSKEARIRILSVREISFRMDESLFVQNKEAMINFIQNTSFNKEQNIVVFDLTVNLHYPETPEKILIESVSKNVFAVEQLENFIGENNTILLPARALIAIVGMAISHARAFIAKSTAGSLYQFTIIPIMSVFNVAKVFFPNIAAETDRIKEQLKAVYEE